MNIFLPIEKLKNVGPKNLPRLNKLGIKTVKDLLWHFPVRYEDYTKTAPIAEIEAGQKINIRGEVVKITVRRIFPRRMSVTTAIVQDQSGAVKAVWFNQPYIADQLTEGTFVSLAGKIHIDKHGTYLSNPTYEKIFSFNPVPTDTTADDSDLPDETPVIRYEEEPANLIHTGGFVPVYPETEGITSKYLRFLIKPLLPNCRFTDHLPEAISKKYGFRELNAAVNSIHFPKNENEAQNAKERLAFDDLFLFQLKALTERRKLNQLKSVPVAFDQKAAQDFVAGLPFELTHDQKVAAWEILKDLQKSYPMNRLLEGDVGSGKTVVALLAAVQTAQSGYQTVFLAPTEVLARQHFKTITDLTRNKDINIGLLTGSSACMNDQEIKKGLLKNKSADGTLDIIIGTHAVIQKDVAFKNLALVVIDEQHRFGINQRAALIKNQGGEKINSLIPHLLSMTATPIPRNLALTIYGDLDISIIKEKPKNRKKIITSVTTPSKIKWAYDFIREEVAKGRQVFVICPRIEPDEPKIGVFLKTRQLKMNMAWADAKAVEEEYKKLSKEIFPDLKVAMLHGKMKPKDKNRIMEDFKNGVFNILVSTSVIEVGVDVPNATVMAIESAERFGLAQLHQFRGRVGRDEYQSYCLLFSSTADKKINKRLEALVECDDGFVLAEKDMAIRGPGEFFGVKQSGLPDLGMASLANVDLIKKARFEARLLLKEDPGLKKYPLLSKKLESFQRLTHFE